MPAELDRMVEALMRKGMSKAKAFRIARGKLGSDADIKRRRRRKKK